MEEVKSVKKNVFFNALYTLLNILFPLVTFSYASRILCADGMGRVTFYTSVANYSMMIGSLGISTYGIRKVAQVRSDKRLLTKTIEELFLLNSFFTVCVILVLTTISIFVPRLNEDLWLLYINCVYILLAPLGMDWAYSGLEQYKYITVRSFICKLLALIPLFIFVHDKNDYIKYAIIVIAAASSSWIINFIHIRKFVDKPVKSKELEYKQHLRPMLFLFSSLLAVSVYTNVDTIMLGFINGDEQVGFYTVATKVKTVLLTLVNSISAVLLPRMSYYIKNGEEELFKQTIKKSISIIFFMAIPLCIFFEVSAPETIRILGGEGYEPAIIIMRIIMPILLVSGFSNITGNQILIPRGQDSSFMIAVTVGAVADIILNAMLMTQFAAIGAAIATLLAEVIQMSIQAFRAKDYLRRNIEYIYIIKTFIVSFIVGGFTWFATTLIPEIKNSLAESIIIFVIKGCLFFGIYLIISFVTKDRIFMELFNDIILKKIKNHISHS